ncbi:MAG: tyrosine--tRNA ligase [Acidimicrobiales bacterium]|jgi:tyrosyl-tRNA synthetase
MPTLSEDLSWRGLIEQESPQVRRALDTERHAAYVGFDPSAASLHIGHLLGIITLRRLQDAGHRPISLAGGGTGLIGDPGGKATERPLLSLEQIAENVDGIRTQLAGLLDFSADRGSSQALLLNNADWLVSFRLIDFLRDIGKHFSVNQMIAKESVSARIGRPEQGISFTEFSYMLLQATDFLHLFDEYGCRFQMGGSDQWGNITMGLDLIRKARGEEAHAFTWPLLVRSDGAKMGKSEEGAVWLDRRLTPTFAMYQWFVRVPDADVGVMLRRFTFLSHDEIERLEQATKDHPERRDAQLALAGDVCTFVHGREETARAERAARALYTEEIATLDADLLADVVADAPSSVLARTTLEGDGLDLTDGLVASGLCSSKSEARRVISQGGAYVDNVRRGGGEIIGSAAAITRADLLADRYVLLRRGKQDYHVLIFE